MTEQTQEAVAQEEQQVGLELRDIAAAAQIINVCVSRGAIRAEEAAEVGMVYNKLAAFIQAAAPAQTEGAEGEGEGEAEAAAE